METTRRFARWLGAIFLGVAAASAIRSAEPQTWWLENLAVVFALALAAWGVRMGRFSRLSLGLVFVFLCLHELGAHFTYSLVPYDSWSRALTGHSLNEALGWQRNHFDRFVHFLFGLLITLPIRELALAPAQRRGFWSYLLPVQLSLSGSAVYELVEWGRPRFSAVTSASRTLALKAIHGTRRRTRVWPRWGPSSRWPLPLARHFAEGGGPALPEHAIRARIEQELRLRLGAPIQSISGACVRFLRQHMAPHFSIARRVGGPCLLRPLGQGDFPVSHAAVLCGDSRGPAADHDGGDGTVVVAHAAHAPAGGVLSNACDHGGGREIVHGIEQIRERDGPRRSGPNIAAGELLDVDE